MKKNAGVGTENDTVVILEGYKWTYGEYVVTETKPNKRI